ncbi:helix-turn-helix transcriptional regulator [Pseudomonas boanensis]|uniref:LexA family transcriptional regulator n=1 Tax=Metapseudomonas boanensis TaxID=2822138 RepID=UPI0035D4EE7B
MLTGPELGAAIEAAVAKKGITKKKLAEDFGVKPPSVQGWVKNGRIDKSRLFELLAYFSDVVDASHWGLPEGYNAALGNQDAKTEVEVSQASSEKTDRTPIVMSTGSGKTLSTVALLRAMLATKAGKALSEAARDRLMLAAEEEADQAPAKRVGNVIPGDFSRPARLTDGDILIPQYDVRASMGHGQVPADYAEFVRNVVVSGPQLEKLGLEYTSPAHLSIITGWGQSMEGTINDKDPVIVDRGVTEFAGDGVYVLTWDDHLYIKRLQKADADHFDLISDNPKHKDRVVPMEEVTIHAKVLLVWNAKKV